MIRAVAALALLLLAGALVWLGAAPWLGDRRALTAAEAGAPEAPPELRLDIIAAAAPADYQALAKRPLFSAVRRPPPPETPGAPLADPRDDLLLGRYEIAGVVMLGDGAMAMLRDEDGRLIRIRAGDKLPTRRGEAEVVAISMTALTFREGGEKVVASVGAAGSDGQ